MARADFGRKERDGSRGVLAPAATRHRVTRPSDRASLYGESRPSVGTALRGALLDYAGVILMLLFAALVLMA